MGTRVLLIVPLLCLSYVNYLYLTINTCSTLSFAVFVISEINNYLEYKLPFSYKIPILENIVDSNCPYIWRNVSFAYEIPQLKKCMNSDCLDVYHNNSTRKHFWCAVRFASHTSCPMTIFELGNKAYEIDPRFAGNVGHSTAMKILTNISQDGLMLMTSRKYVTPFHSAATKTHHFLLRGKKVWCFLHSQARSVLQINSLTDIPVYSSIDILALYQSQPFHCITQNAGDIIYLPPFVYHFVYSYGNTIALTTHQTSDIIHAARSYLFDQLYTNLKKMIFISDSYRESQLEMFEMYLLNKVLK